MSDQQAKGGVNNGDVVYFKEAKKSTKRTALGLKFKGHAFGVLLGHVPPFAKEPDPIQLLRCMGTIGFLTFDDVAEFLGDEFGAKCVKMYEDKYYGVEAQEAAPEVAPPPPEPSILADQFGAPLQSVSKPEVTQ